jgi:hypothetical protein
LRRDRSLNRYNKDGQIIYPGLLSGGGHMESSKTDSGQDGAGMSSTPRPLLVAPDSAGPHPLSINPDRLAAARNGPAGVKRAERSRAGLDGDDTRFQANQHRQQLVTHHRAP